jgi:hypothetical protein
LVDGLHAAENELGAIKVQLHHFVAAGVEPQ